MLLYLHGGGYVIGNPQDYRVLTAEIGRATGVRTVVRTLASASFGSAVSVIVADWIDDGRWYAYNYSTVPSILFAVTGASPR